MRRHKLESRFNRATDYEEWYVVRYPDVQLVDDLDELDELDTELLGTIVVIRDQYSRTTKVKFLVHCREEKLKEFEPIVQDICHDLGIYEGEVKIVKCDLVGFRFSLSDPEDNTFDAEDSESDDEASA